MKNQTEQLQGMQEELKDTAKNRKGSTIEFLLMSNY